MTLLTHAEDTGRSLLPADLRERLVEQLMHRKEYDRALARRIIVQTAAFVKVCGDHPDMVLAPSRLVAEGWHAFILDTAVYAMFCERVAGRFVHHRPQVEPVNDALKTDARAAIERAGFKIDAELWDGTANCSQCHAGCTDGP